MERIVEHTDKNLGSLFLAFRFYSHTNPNAPANNSAKCLHWRDFGPEIMGNIVSVTFFQKVLVTTTGSGNFCVFPYVKGFLAAKSAKKGPKMAGF
jgi:hypothetical protein